MRSSADWSADERSVVGKILKAMGVGVLERRAWLSKLRQDLLKLDADTSKTSRGNFPLTLTLTLTLTLNLTLTLFFQHLVVAVL